MPSNGHGGAAGKAAAGEKAALLVSPGMTLGLGTGSTVAFFLEALGRRLARGELHGIKGVPTSLHTEGVAIRLRIPLTTLEAAGVIDLTIDGADEVDPELDLIKGLGGALLREKMVAQATRRFVIIVDQSKVVPRLGTRSPVPVEVIPFGWRTHLGFIHELGGRAERRALPGGEPFLTDNGNFILDCRFAGGIEAPQALAEQLAFRAGVVGHGLFLGMANEVLVGEEGGVRSLKRPEVGEA